MSKMIYRVKCIKEMEAWVRGQIASRHCVFTDDETLYTFSENCKVEVIPMFPLTNSTNWMIEYSLTEQHPEPAPVPERDEGLISALDLYMELRRV